MPSKEMKIMVLICRLCGHEWVPRPLGRLDKPAYCPNCKRPWWDAPRGKETP